MEIRRRNAAATEVCNFGGNGKPWGNVASSSSGEIFEGCSTRSSWSTWDRWESLLVQWFKRDQRSHIQIKILDTSHKEVDLTLGNDITTTSSESKRKHITKPFNLTSPICIHMLPFSELASKEPLPGSHSVLQQRLRSVSQDHSQPVGRDLHQGYPPPGVMGCNGSIKVLLTLIIFVYGLLMILMGVGWITMRFVEYHCSAQNLETCDLWISGFHPQICLCSVFQ